MTRVAWRQDGQVTLEYFILLAVIVLVTLVSLTSFDEDVRTHVENLFTGAAHAITH